MLRITLSMVDKLKGVRRDGDYPTILRYFVLRTTSSTLSFRCVQNGGNDQLYLNHQKSKIIDELVSIVQMNEVSRSVIASRHPT